MSWRSAEVVDARPETPRVRTLTIDVPGWPGHQPGQHVDLRLTAEDGYQAVRSYSIASAPEEDLRLTVERIDDGEVSPYLVGDLRPGDRFEVRGPIGGYFVWDHTVGGPLLLVAGGSGIVPLAAMIRHRVVTGSDVPIRLVYSSRSFEDIIYREELDRLAASAEGISVVYTLTRNQPPGWSGYARRIDRDLLEAEAWPPAARPLAFVCGPTQFVETSARALLELGHDRAAIKTERFGPTGR